jgi:hypothetical protein
LAVTAEHEGSNSDPTGSAGFKGHPNTPSNGATRLPLSTPAISELIMDRDESVTNSSVVVLSKASRGGFQHRGRKLVNSTK